MIQSNKSNLAIRRGRDHLFERDVSNRKRNKKKRRKVLPAPPHVRREFQEKLRRELRHERLLAMGLIVAIITLAVGAYYLRYIQ